MALHEYGTKAVQRTVIVLASIPREPLSEPQLYNLRINIDTSNVLEQNSVETMKQAMCSYLFDNLINSSNKTKLIS